MPRLRQLHPGNYRTSGNISDDMENLVRYLNAAEHGDFTVGELLAKLFNSDGEFDGPVELRVDTSNGMQYRIGEYTEAEDGWITLINIADLRGTDGANVGTIEGEIFHNREDQTATAAQTDFTYAWEATGEEPLVFQNGVLLTETTDYTATQASSLIQLTSGATLNDKITLITIRTGTVTDYRRTDVVAASGQAVVPFVHDEEETLLVYKNGILQEDGGANDYSADATSNTITFTSTLALNDKVSIITVTNQALQNVNGLMLEAAYTDGSGYIPYAKLNIADNDIPQAKVNGLTALLSDRGRTYVQATEPVDKTAGNDWIDTSQTPNVAYFSDGVAYLPYDAGDDVPAYIAANAGQFLKVNATATALEYGDPDTSALVPKTYMGAANGVASLDSAGQIPVGQLPEIFAGNSIYHKEAGAVANGDYVVKLIFYQKIRIDGIVLRSSSGTGTVQLLVDGGLVGTTYGVSSTKTDNILGASIEVDATAASKEIGFQISSASTLNDVEITLAVATLSV